MSTLWRCTEANVKRVRRSALLPLDFDHILLGSGEYQLADELTVMELTTFQATGSFASHHSRLS